MIAHLFKWPQKITDYCLYHRNYASNECMVSLHEFRYMYIECFNGMFSMYISEPEIVCWTKIVIYIFWCFFSIQWIDKLKCLFVFVCLFSFFFCQICLYYTYHLRLIHLKKLTYQCFDWYSKNSPTSLHISWSREILCRVCCLAHSSHSGSGSAHVLQMCVALTWIFSIEHGSQSTSFSCWLFSLNHNKNIKYEFDLKQCLNRKLHSHNSKN